MASACPLSISNGSGWLLQNCASVCCPHLRVLLVCLLESAISHVFQRILRMFSKFAYYAFTHLTRFPTITGDVSVTQEKRFLPLSASFSNSRTIDVAHFPLLSLCCIKTQTTTSSDLQQILEIFSKFVHTWCNTLL